MSTNSISAAAALLVACGSVYAWYSGDSMDRYVARLNHADVMAELRRDIPHIVDDNGAAYAVELTDRLIRDRLIGIDECHLVLHLVGHAAAQEYGSDYGAIMDANTRKICLNGFVHGIEAEVAAQGDRRAVWDFCTFIGDKNLKNGPCYHGVGHSVFERTKNIAESLRYCDSLTGGPEADLTNCYRGVFSEVGAAVVGYDSNTGFAVDPIDLASQGFSREQPYAYCASLPLQYQDSCYSQLAKLLYASDEPSASIEKCVAAGLPAARRECVKTIAGMSMRMQLDTIGVAQVAAFLNALPQSVREDAIAGVRDAYHSHCATNERLFVWSELCPLLTDPAARGACTVTPAQCVPVAGR